MRDQSPPLVVPPSPGPKFVVPASAGPPLGVPASAGPDSALPFGPAPLGLTQSEWEQHHRDQLTARAAAARPLPGPLKTAFAQDPRAVAGLTFRQPVLGDFTILEKLKSEFLTSALSGQQVPLEARELILLIFIFTRHPATSRELLAAGPQALRDAAASALEDVPLAQLPALADALIKSFSDGFSTALAHAPASDPGTSSFPQDPPTASAGGSPSSLS